MFDARTAWAIALLLAPTGAVTAGSMTGVSAPAGHTAFVEITVDAEDDQASDLAQVEALVTCQAETSLAEAMAWIDDDCQVPPGSAIYVSRADTPDPRDHGLQPTGTVLALDGSAQEWQTREYTYGPPSEPDRYRAYVLDPQRVAHLDTDTPQPVRGMVDLDAMGVQPGDSIPLTPTLGAGPQATIEDPDVRHVDADRVPSLGSTESGVTG